MSAQEEIRRFLQKFCSPPEIANVLKLVEESNREAESTGYAKGIAEGRSPRAVYAGRN